MFHELSYQEFSMFKKEHIFIFLVGVDLVDQTLIGHCRDGEYVVSGQPTFGGFERMIGLKFETDGDREPPRIDVASSSQSSV